MQINLEERLWAIIHLMILVSHRTIKNFSKDLKKKWSNLDHDLDFVGKVMF